MISYLRSTVLGKVRIERVTQTKFSALQFEYVATVYLFKVPPATSTTEYFVAWPHYLSVNISIFIQSLKRYRSVKDLLGTLEPRDKWKYT